MARDNSAQVLTQKVKRSRGILTRFSFKSARRGTIFYGIAAGGMFALQGLAFAASYKGDVARAKFATTLASNPGLGIMYGEARKLETASGYMVYRSLPFMAFIGALWALFVSTRLLRGQEEDGKLELLLAGKNSLASATRKIFYALGLSWSTAFILCGVILTALSRSPEIAISISSSWFLALATLAPAALGFCIGLLMSQLASTRRKALAYGLIPIIILFVLRSVGNIIDSLKWLKYLTPFGWVDKLHAITGSEWQWFLPFIVVCVVCATLSLWIVKKRDFSDSVIADNPTAKARLKLLSGPLGLSFRLTLFNLLGWFLATLGVSALIASLAKTATSVASDSPQISDALNKLSNSANLRLAFFSLSGFFIALLLMVVAASGMNRLREDEAKGYLDNFLVAKISRTRWLLERVGLLLTAVTAICFGANLACWILGLFQNLDISFTAQIFGGLNYIAPAVLLLGFGSIVYAIAPRYTSLALYTWIVWSFLVEMIGSVVNFRHYLLDTSLLRQISMVPGATADWQRFMTVTSIGLAAFIVGLLAFTKRDLQSE